MGLGSIRRCALCAVHACRRERKLPGVAMRTALELRAVLCSPFKEFTETLRTHFSGCRIATVFILAVAHFTQALMDATSSMWIFSLVLGPVNREEILRLLGQIEPVRIRLSPRLEGIVGFCVRTMKDGDHLVGVQEV